MKTIIFSDSLPNKKITGNYVDFSGNQSNENRNHGLEGIKLTTLYHRFGREWFEQFSEWLGRLNCEHAGLFWWAHTATAKNLLSSPLGQYYFQVRAVCEIAGQDNISALYILGATPAQMNVIASFLSVDKFQFLGRAWRLRGWRQFINNVKALAKQWIHLGSVLAGFLMYSAPKNLTTPDLCLFTYIDGVRREGADNYFGKLPALLRENNKFHSILYLAFVYRPYWRRLKKLKEGGGESYLVLYGLLKMTDYAWALRNTLGEWWANSYYRKELSSGTNSYTPILKEVFVNETSGYFHNLLVYKAICQFVARYAPKTMAYPFENKSLEKMILLAINTADHRTKMVGYQHTSVTPKHATLFFIPGEAACTPLPDKIITVGDISKNYLETLGNYPPEIFIKGGALRQVWGERFSRQYCSPMRVLLALSSSREELIQSLEFFKVVMQEIPSLELGVRPHINFPLTLLPHTLAAWVSEYALDLSNTLLQDNLNWCSITAYVSSTVALEALMRGRPVVNISIGDIVSSDPLVGKVPFHWRADNPIEMSKILRYVENMSAEGYEESGLQAVSYVTDYLSPINDESLKIFRETLQ